MKLGSIYKCEAYGKVASSDGDYIGGIVGSSDSVVRNSDAKVSLSGGSYTGGIAGYGTDIFDCRAMVELTDAEEAAGAIAGKAEGNVKGNYFVDGDWGGVDDISFAGEAEPMAYEDFIAIEGLPERFRSFYLTYMANGAVVDEVAYTYGEKQTASLFLKCPNRKVLLEAGKNCRKLLHLTELSKPFTPSGVLPLRHHRPEAKQCYLFCWQKAVLKMVRKLPWNL